MFYRLLILLKLSSKQ